MITRYEDVCRVLLDHRRFSSRRGTTPVTLELDLPPAGADQMLTDSDPPLHTRLREPLNRALAMRSVRAREPRIRDAVVALLQPALDGEPLDLAAATRTLPTAIAGTLMGIPEALWPELSRLATAAVAYHDPAYAQGCPLTTPRPSRSCSTATCCSSARPSPHPTRAPAPFSPSPTTPANTGSSPEIPG
ncbi:hypothetical protein [Nonomuraea typhae]|uniref:Cytochrome P450 n=1 Tax=Nonomuraea typhae TaxID=2603600 RepID=A0ABW7ZBV8_9ACTN